MDALVAEEPHEVEGGALLLAVLDGAEEGGVIVEAAIVDGLVYLLEGLPDDAPRAHREVPRLRAALRPLGEPHGVTRALQEGPRVLPHVARVVRHIRLPDGVALRLLRVAPAVADDEDNPTPSHEGV